jgi:phosphocarrier protein
MDEDCDCPEIQIPAGALYGEFQIVNKKGLHARATAKFVQCAGRYDADITVSRCGETVGATSIMGVLTLGAGIGSTITIVATGAEAKPALEALAALIADRFGEGE